VHPVQASVAFWQKRLGTGQEESCTFLTEKVLRGQNYKFALTFSQNKKTFSTRYCVFGRKFFDRLIFRRRRVRTAFAMSPQISFVVRKLTWMPDRACVGSKII